MIVTDKPLGFGLSNHYFRCVGSVKQCPESVNWSVMRSYLEEQLPSYLEMLEKMVNINSFTANPEGVNELGKLTADLFANLGFEAEFVPSVNEKYGQHLVLTRNGRSNQALGFVSHLDTVFPAEEEKRNNFHWRLDGERIYGPGTVDIKGGTVMMYMVPRWTASTCARCF